MNEQIFRDYFDLSMLISNVHSFTQTRLSSFFLCFNYVKAFFLLARQHHCSFQFIFFIHFFFGTLGFSQSFFQSAAFSDNFFSMGFPANFSFLRVDFPGRKTIDWPQMYQYDSFSSSHDLFPPVFSFLRVDFPGRKTIDWSQMYQYESFSWSHDLFRQ